MIYRELTAPKIIMFFPRKHPNQTRHLLLILLASSFGKILESPNPSLDASGGVTPSRTPAALPSPSRSGSAVDPTTAAVDPTGAAVDPTGSAVDPVREAALRQHQADVERIIQLQQEAVNRLRFTF